MEDFFMAHTDVLLVYPQLGDWDDVMRDVPLSVIYAATHAIKKGFSVKVVDLRFSGSDWAGLIDPILKEGCSLVGISVMTGTPIINSLEVTRYVKKWFPGTSVVWGGPHPSTLPEQTLAHPDIDFVIQDYGSVPLAQLIEHLQGGDVRKEEILGLGYKDCGKIRLSPPQTGFEVLDYCDIPYHLLDISGKRYNRMNTGELVFPIFMSMGCPYQCTFCEAPARVKRLGDKKWVSLSADSVLDHIQYLSERYEFKELQVYDDESFINLEVMKDLLNRYIGRGFNKRFRLDFRGIRFTDIDRMDDDYLQLIADAGTQYMFIGLESGSPRMLKLMKKSVRIEQILRVNKRLAKFSSLKPNYNFFCGLPGENYESLLETKKVLLQLIKDHPNCYLGHGGHWKPIPGTEVTDIAVREYALKLPATIEGWAKVDTLLYDESVPDYSWYNPQIKGMIKLLTLAALVLDGKVTDLYGNLTRGLGLIALFLVKIYRPLLRLRLKFNFSWFLFEMKLHKLSKRKVGRFLRQKHCRDELPKPSLEAVSVRQVKLPHHSQDLKQSAANF